MSSGLEHLVETVSGHLGRKGFDLAIILGSGLGGLAEQAEASEVFDYRDFSCFPETSVAGHAGRLVAGTFRSWRVLFFQGRFHLYQGLTANQVSVPVQVAHRLGCRRILLTNAVGGINRAFRPGDFMFIDDHINLLGDNPLRGFADQPFVDLSDLYSRQFFAPLEAFAQGRGIGLHRGVLAALQGPSYETPAEIRMLRLLGADAVSMSTVPEAIMARYLDMEVVGLSFVSNIAAGLGKSPLDHEDVLAAGFRGAASFAELVGHLADLWQKRTTCSNHA